MLAVEKRLQETYEFDGVLWTDGTFFTVDGHKVGGKNMGSIDLLFEGLQGEAYFGIPAYVEVITMTALSFAIDLGLTPGGTV